MKASSVMAKMAGIVYTSNVFAILGLRSMYFMLGDVMHRFTYLNYGLAVVLIFIGTKMLITDIYKIPTTLSLAVVAVAIGASIAISAWANRRAPTELDDHEPEPGRSGS